MTEQVISPLRRRMIEDMTIRKFAAKTQHDYVQGSRSLRPFSAAPPIPPVRRTCAAFSGIWRRAAPTASMASSFSVGSPRV
jgi:hypothetical protein